MIERGDFRKVRDAMLDAVCAVHTEKAALEQASGRILAGDIVAAEDNPPFARSPYDGYAFRAADVAEASRDHPVTLRVIDEIPAGETPHRKITVGTAAHLMTGAPIPEGADAVLPFERTRFTKETVTIFGPSAQHSSREWPAHMGSSVRAASALPLPLTQQGRTGSSAFRSWPCREILPRA